MSSYSRPDETPTILDDNIKNNRPSKVEKSFLQEYPAALELVENLTSSNPNMRLPTRKVLAHPFFWSDVKSSIFIREAFEWLLLRGSAQLSVERSLEIEARKVFDYNWSRYIDGDLYNAISIDSKGLQKFYDERRLVELMRLYRNGVSHISGVLKELKTVNVSKFIFLYFNIFLLLIFHV